MLGRLKQAYVVWQGILSHTPKYIRQTVGQKIDSLFLETLEWTFRAGYLAQPQKLAAVLTAVNKLDLVKFFILVGWENAMFTDKQYISLSEPLVEAGKMLVGWKEYLEKKNPPPSQ